MPAIRRAASAAACIAHPPHRCAGAASLVLASALLSACATPTVDQSLARLADIAKPHAGSTVELARSEADRKRAAELAASLLDSPLTADAAVRLGLVNSPALQVLLAEHAVAATASLQDARPGNPVLTLERLVRGDVIEIGRLLTVGITDLFTLPARGRIADARLEAQTLRSANEVVQLAFDVRQAWVVAVAAQQTVSYTLDVKLAAEAGNELARRMLAAGNFSRLQRAREQTFHADAIAQHARAEQAAIAAREQLTRLLGLSREQASRLALPDRLPDLPAVPRAESETSSRAFDERLDVRIARHELDATARSYGLTRVTSVVDGVQLGAQRNSESGAPAQRGWELELPLPVFDTGDARRAGAEAAYLAALNRTAQVAVEAQSQVNQAYRTYAGAFELARHYRDEIVPLRQVIAEENTLRYNGMLISVFELLADARERVDSVIAAIEAQRDLWLADTALDAALIGRPPAAVALPTARSRTAPAAGPH